MIRARRGLLHLGIAIALLIVGASGAGVLVASKRQIKKAKPEIPAPAVRTLAVRIGPYTVHTRGEGTVRPLREVELAPQVSGKVVHVSPWLVNGGEFRHGDTLLRIDPVDYELGVTLARAKVKDAETRLALAEQEAEAARREWRLLVAGGPQEGAEKEPPPLVAKEPQLAAARAAVDAARADLSKALLNLERTDLRAPFDGRVGEKQVDIGQYVSPGQALASLLSTDAAEIVVPLEDAHAYWFHVPGFTPGDGPGSAAVVRARVAGREETWRGRVVRSEGRLDERTRMLNVVVRVERPYAKKPPLAAGLFVSVEIEGRALARAAVLPRFSLHPDDTVWVVDENQRLRFRKVEVARVHGDEAVIQDGLKDGDRVVVTPLKAVTDGMAVRIGEMKEADRP